MPVRIIVCGGRDYADRARVFEVLDNILLTRGISEIIQGEAPGADRWAREWALNRDVKLTRCRAEWEKYGKRAGPVRNRHMLTLKPDGVVAFPGGRGTLDMISAAQEAGVPVYRPSPSGQL
ncbi:DUF2493 domain-containing protein [Pseudomonas songnenensis]|uniref:DUF2493 domain-containing protein n=1 Tax=Pseudomonas songnenensis TaxID=1176259 RepID=A0ABX9UMZ1_9PSED|nr:DUF2493 domain-containing protein [Pseudomonas songnenensis]MCQ4302205.1 DUF2493 domain-containing protein [Pseudomonas songnenensis]RMH93265.1 DUF2493 domain-containing protein [Pseudomonas songnenensis]